MIGYDSTNELSSVLSSNEKLIWTGRPKTGIVFRKSDFFMIPFSLLWGGFAFFTGVELFFYAKGPAGPKLFIIPFILIGIYITIGRFFVDARRRSNTIYGITPDRIIIKSGIFSSEIKSLNIRTLSDITISQQPDNSGTISFGPADYRYAAMEGMNWPGSKQTPKLEYIENVKSVYDRIIELQRLK